mmetsp:Transcript_336/g.575  ORF Transcript_336/g.575 Transcript_336/m.575 type:complete len:267 (-) Transcript_336:582-1382(-)
MSVCGIAQNMGSVPIFKNKRVGCREHLIGLAVYEEIVPDTCFVICDSRWQGNYAQVRGLAHRVKHVLRRMGEPRNSCALHQNVAGVREWEILHEHVRVKLEQVLLTASPTEHALAMAGGVEKGATRRAGRQAHPAVALRRRPRRRSGLRDGMLRRRAWRAYHLHHSRLVKRSDDVAFHEQLQARPLRRFALVEICVGAAFVARRGTAHVRTVDLHLFAGVHRQQHRVELRGRLKVERELDVEGALDLRLHQPQQRLRQSHELSAQK